MSHISGGDQNQSLYEDDEVPLDSYWHANGGVIPLNQTRRFETEIAVFASRLTARSPQHIDLNHRENKLKPLHNRGRSGSIMALQ
jgi:hypothetical protein